MIESHAIFQMSPDGRQNKSRIPHGARLSLSKNSLREFERAAALPFLIIFGSIRLRIVHDKVVPAFRGYGALRTVLAPSILRFPSALRSAAKRHFQKIKSLICGRNAFPARLHPIRPRTALTLVRGYTLCGALRVALR